MNMKCKICGNVNNNKIIQVKERITEEGKNFDYLQCSACKSVMLNEKIEDISKWYPSSYSPYLKRNKKKRSLAEKLRMKIIFSVIIHLKNRNIFQKVLRIRDFDILLKRMYGTKINKKDRIVDVGCGDGHWLDYLVELGYKNVTGIDLFVPEKNMNSCNWKFIKGDIFSLQGKYDCIILNHSFEHMNNPQEVLEKIERHLSDSGICVISVPVANGIAYRKYKNFFSQFDAPRHLFLHTEKGMKIMCKDAHLRVENVLYDSNERIFYFSECLKRTDLLFEEIKQNDFPEYCYKAIKIDKVIKSNLNSKGDQAIFYITKSKN